MVSTELPSWFRQTTVLTHRAFLDNLRNVGVFWMRLAMYMMLCLVRVTGWLVLVVLCDALRDECRMHAGW